MALELLEDSPVFARHMAECEEALAPHLDFVLRDVLEGAPGAPSLEQIEVVQPALFAVTVSLARLWQACGLEPAAVAGHSQGEVAAAHIAGGLSLADAARLAAVRAKLISELAGKGGMVSLIAPRERLEALISPWQGEIEVAAHNGPSSTVVSGTRSALDQLLARCEEEEGIHAREVPAAIPSHSHFVEELRERALEAFADISPRQGSIPLHSTVTGELIDTAELDGEYWYRNLRRPVLFEQVCRELIAAGHSSLIEISPHPVLNVAVAETIERLGAEAKVIETLRRDQGGAERFARSLAGAHAAGAPVQWEAFFAGAGAKRVDLPTYPFQRRRFWLSPAAGAQRSRLDRPTGALSPLPGGRDRGPREAEVTFSGRISLQEHPWLADHAVLGEVLLPGTALLELALSVAGAPRLEGVGELTLQRADAPARRGRPWRCGSALSAPEESGERRDLDPLKGRAPSRAKEEWTPTPRASSDATAPGGG